MEKNITPFNGTITYGDGFYTEEYLNWLEENDPKTYSEIHDGAIEIFESWLE